MNHEDERDYAEERANAQLMLQEREWECAVCFTVHAGDVETCETCAKRNAEAIARHAEEVARSVRVAAVVASVHEAIGDGFTFGTVRVAYDGPEWTYGGAWLRATCAQCGAHRVMRATSAEGIESSARYLASTVSRYSCAHGDEGSVTLAYLALVLFLSLWLLAGIVTS